MTLTNSEILSHIDRALKGLSVDDLGDSALTEEQASTFIETAELATSILPDARFYLMNAGTRNIDRIGFAGRILSSGKNADGDTRAPDGVKPLTATNQLVARELVAITGIEDDTLEENIARGTLETTLLQLFGRAAGRDMEEFALFGDTAVTFATDDVLSQTDGWLKRAAQKVYGQDEDGQVARDFDPSANNFPENMFDAMLNAMPEAHLADVQDLRFYVDWSTQNAYRDLLKSRGTALGDTAQTANNDLFYKGIRVVYVPLTSRAPAVTDAEADLVEGRAALLTRPNNLAWGVRRQMRIEPDRQPKLRKTDFVLTVRVDADYEDENGAVAAFIDKANPESD